MLEHADVYATAAREIVDCGHASSSGRHLGKGQSPRQEREPLFAEERIWGGAAVQILSLPGAPFRTLFLSLASVIIQLNYGVKILIFYCS